MTKELEINKLLNELENNYLIRKQKNILRLAEKDKETVARNKAVEIENEIEGINLEITKSKNRLLEILGETING